MPLKKHIETDFKRDSDGSWAWAVNSGPPGLYSAGTPKLWERLYAADRRAILVPVQAAYRSGTAPDNHDFVDTTVQLAGHHGFSVNDHIYKVNYTGATIGGKAINTPSVFTSPASGKYAVIPGGHYVLVDDVIATGGTLRDLIRLRSRVCDF